MALPPLREQSSPFAAGGAPPPLPRGPTQASGSLEQRRSSPANLNSFRRVAVGNQAKPQQQPNPVVNKADALPPAFSRFNQSQRLISQQESRAGISSKVHKPVKATQHMERSQTHKLLQQNFIEPESSEETRGPAGMMASGDG